MAAKTTNDVTSSDIKNIAAVFASLVTVGDGSQLSGIGKELLEGTLQGEEGQNANILSKNR